MFDEQTRRKLKARALCDILEGESANRVSISEPARRSLERIMSQTEEEVEHAWNEKLRKFEQLSQLPSPMLLCDAAVCLEWEQEGTTRYAPYCPIGVQFSQGDVGNLCTVTTPLYWEEILARAQSRDPSQKEARLLYLRERSAQPVSRYYVNLPDPPPLTLARLEKGIRVWLTTFCPAVSAIPMAWVTPKGALCALIMAHHSGFESVEAMDAALKKEYKDIT